MKQEIFTILENRQLTPYVYRMSLGGDVSAVTVPGQFVNIRVDGKFLRRPVSVSDWDDASLTILYKVVGQGTEAMAAMRPGQKLDVLTGLGNGFDISGDCKAPLLIGGGIGLSPLVRLAKELVKAGKIPTVILGFNTSEEVFGAKEFKALGCPVTVSTVDGSCGVKGFVTDAMQGLVYDYFYACGPEPMLKAVYTASKTDGQLSFEARMGCGFGACMGCSCKTVTGYKRICREGPVLRKEEILWDA